MYVLRECVFVCVCRLIDFAHTVLLNTDSLRACSPPTFIFKNAFSKILMLAMNARYVAPDDIASFKAAGADDVLAKPLTSARADSLIKNLISKRSHSSDGFGSS